MPDCAMRRFGGSARLTAPENGRHQIPRHWYDVRRESTGPAIADPVGLAVKRCATFDTLCQHLLSSSSSLPSRMSRHIHMGQQAHHVSWLAILTKLLRETSYFRLGGPSSTCQLNRNPLSRRTKFSLSTDFSHEVCCIKGISTSKMALLATPRFKL